MRIAEVSTPTRLVRRLFQLQTAEASEKLAVIFKNPVYPGFPIQAIVEFTDSGNIGINNRRAILKCIENRRYLSGLDLSKLDLSGVAINLDRCVEFTGSTLNDTNLMGSYLADVKMISCEMRNANFEGSKFQNVTLYASNIFGGKFDNVNASESQFSSINAHNATFKNGNFSECDFSCAKLSRAQFQNADLQGANFSCADLEHANFSGANLAGASFAHANLSYVDFSDAILENNTWRQSSISGTIFKKGYQVTRIDFNDLSIAISVDTIEISRGNHVISKPLNAFNSTLTAWATGNNDSGVMPDSNNGSLETWMYNKAGVSELLFKLINHIRETLAN